MADESSLPNKIYHAASLSDIADMFLVIANNVEVMGANLAKTERAKRDVTVQAATWREAAEILRQTTMGKKKES